MSRSRCLAFVFTICPFLAVFLLPTSTVDSEIVTKTNDNSKAFLRKNNKPTVSSTVGPVDNDDLPLFVLHVGPRNTGAATIQSVAARHQDLLEKDNFYFLGHNSSQPESKTHQLYIDCSTGFQDKDQVDCRERWKAFEKIVEHHLTNKHNVFLSDELFSSFPNFENMEERNLFQHLVPLLENKWRVRIIFSYRRYYEWIHSRFSQLFSPERWEFGGEMAEIWPNLGGKEIHSFPDFFKAVQKDECKHPHAIKDRWEDRFSGLVQVFNFDQGGNFVENFFCQAMPEATSLCQDIQTTGGPKKLQCPSTSVMHQYEAISIEAYRRGWVSNSHSPAQVIRAVETYAQEHNYKRKSDFALKCLTDNETGLLLNMSLNMEQEMVPDFYTSAMGEQKLRSDFAAASDAGLFCSIDAKGILEDDGWKQIFEEFTPAPMLDGNIIDSESKSDLPIDYPQLDTELSWLGIGAQGAGTTWLAEMLMDCCPTVTFGSRKELHFWDWYRRYGLGWYSKQLRNQTTITDEKNEKLFHGEITPHYMSLPDEDIREIRALFPSVRIIFMARDLVDRTWSNLRKSLRKEVKHGKASTLNPANYTDEFFMKKASGRGPMERSAYEVGMKRWYSHFPEEQILILNFDEIGNDPAGLLRKVLNHIGVEHPETYLKAIEDEEEEKVNPGVYTTLRPSLKQKLEDLFRPHSKAFNQILREHGYSWFLNEY